MSEWPWTPGPWIQDGSTIERERSGRGRVIVADLEYPYDLGANGEIIILAPEMAEAILAWDNCDDQRCCHPAGECIHLYNNGPLRSIADRLRRIGSKND